MNLFDWAEEHARRCDPETAKLAALEIKLSMTLRCSQFLEGLATLGPSTANEVAMFVSGENRGMHDSIRRRATDLVRMGKIRRAGVRECTVTGKRVTYYEVMECSNKESAKSLESVLPS